MGKETPKPNWTELPPELLTHVTQRLPNLADFIRFRAVCPAWRAATAHTSPRQLFPWLLIPSSPDAGLGGFLSLSEARSYHLDLPETRGKSCRGSSHGWLFLLGTTPEVILLNPITRARVDLPPLTAIPHVRGFDPSRTGDEYLVHSPLGGELYTLPSEAVRESYVTKAVLSSNPARDRSCVVVALCAFRLMLAICRVGADSWTEVNLNPALLSVSDVAFHEGRLYALGGNGRVVVCDVAGGSVDVALVPRIKIPIMELGKMLLQDEGYLVESEGELLAVVRSRSDGFVSVQGRRFSRYTESLSVFTLRLGRKPTMAMMESIGDAVLFAGQVASVSASAADFPGCSGDCIYFIDAYLVGNEVGNEVRVETGYGVCVFHLDGEVFERLLCDLGRGLQDLQPPIWFTPSLS